MESYTFKFSNTPQGGAMTIPATGSLFVYESSTNDPAEERRVRVRPDGGGGEIILKPGQQFRTDQTVTSWNIRSYSGAEALAGAFIIGHGAFWDSNTKNTFTLDAAFANNVTVMNDASKRVPVSLDVTQTMPVSLAGQSVEIANDAGNPLPVAVDQNTKDEIGGTILNYTHSYAANTASVAGGAIKLLDAAQNQNGAALVKFDLITGNVTLAGFYAVIAKATAPGSVIDGDLLLVGELKTGVQAITMDLGKVGAVKAQAGKSIWYISSSIDNATLRAALLKAY